MDFKKFQKPSGTKPRRPDALIRGREYKVSQFAKEKSLFPNKRTKEDIFKLIAVYKDFGITFHTYMPYEFDNKPDEYVESLNNDIAMNKNVRIVYYGKISGAYELNILLDGDVVDEDKLKGIKMIEDSEKGCYEEDKGSESPTKKQKTDD